MVKFTIYNLGGYFVNEHKIIVKVYLPQNIKKVRATTDLNTVVFNLYLMQITGNQII